MGDRQRGLGSIFGSITGAADHAADQGGTSPLMMGAMQKRWSAKKDAGGGGIFGGLMESITETISGSLFAELASSETLKFMATEALAEGGLGAGLEWLSDAVSEFLPLFGEDVVSGLMSELTMELGGALFSEMLSGEGLADLAAGLLSEGDSFMDDLTGELGSLFGNLGVGDLLAEIGAELGAAITGELEGGFLSDMMDDLGAGGIGEMLGGLSDAAGWVEDLGGDLDGPGGGGFSEMAMSMVAEALPGPGAGGGGVGALAMSMMVAEAASGGGDG
jgi:hypothetical protein